MHTRTRALLALLVGTVTATACGPDQDASPPPEAGPPQERNRADASGPADPSEPPAPPGPVRSDTDRGQVVETRGTVVVERRGKRAPLEPDEVLAAESTVHLVGADSSLKLRFSDGGRLALVGPAVLELVEIGASGRRVRLVAGTIASAEARGIAIEIQTPLASETSLTLQNASASAVVREDGVVEFSAAEGDYVRIWRGGELLELKGGSWSSAE